MKKREYRAGMTKAEIQEVFRHNIAVINEKERRELRSIKRRYFWPQAGVLAVPAAALICLVVLLVMIK